MISKRLETIAGLVPRNKVVFDVGSDHALLPCYLIEHGLAKKVYAGDNKVGPLENAKTNIKAYGFEDQIETVLSNGLEHAQDDVEVVTISGMGYFTVEKILEAKDISKYDCLIIQINKSMQLLRQYISDHHYTILNETVVKDDFYYEVVVFNTEYHESYTQEEIIYGPVLLKERSDVFLEYLNFKVDQIKKIVANKTTGNESELNELKMLDKIISGA